MRCPVCDPQINEKGFEAEICGDEAYEFTDAVFICGECGQQFYVINTRLTSRSTSTAKQRGE